MKNVMLLSISVDLFSRLPPLLIYLLLRTTLSLPGKNLQNATKALIPL